MPKEELLEGNTLTAKLEGVPNWKNKDNGIETELTAADFVSAVGVVNAIAVHAERLNHHPDVKIYGYNKIWVRLTTHDSGGLTRLDFELAKLIDGISM
ncbi:MAG: 4a-hydroxytetrahydrobiopterin dehydratase [Candidatus Kapaibacteriales bacterium]